MRVMVVRSLAEERSGIYFRDLNQYFLHKQRIKRLRCFFFFILSFVLGPDRTPPPKRLAPSSARVYLYHRSVTFLLISTTVLCSYYTARKISKQNRTASLFCSSSQAER